MDTMVSTIEEVLQKINKVIDEQVYWQRDTKKILITSDLLVAILQSHRKTKVLSMIGDWARSYNKATIQRELDYTDTIDQTDAYKFLDKKRNRIVLALADKVIWDDLIYQRLGGHYGAYTLDMW